MIARLCLIGLTVVVRGDWTYCGQPIPEDVQPYVSTVFYENDLGGTNYLMRFHTNKPDEAEQAVTSGGDLVYGGPSPDYINGHLYFMNMNVENTHVQIQRFNYITNVTETLFKSEKSNFPFIQQAPSQNPTVFDPLTKKLYYYSKAETAATGIITMMDFSGWSSGDAPLDNNILEIVWEDPCNGGGNALDCKVPESLARTTLKVDCLSNVWFNEGLYGPLTKYDFSVKPVARTEVLSVAWLSDNTRCFESECNIGGFHIDSRSLTEHQAGTALIWFSYDRSDEFTSIWKIQMDGTEAEEVYERLNYERYDWGQKIGALDVDHVGEQIVVITWLQNAGGKSIFRLPMEPSGTAISANFYGHYYNKDRDTAPFRAFGEVIVGEKSAACSGTEYNTQMACIGNDRIYTTVCEPGCSLTATRYPAMGSPQIIIIPGKTTPLVPVCADDSPVFKDSNQQLGTSADTTVCEAENNPSVDDYPVVLTQTSGQGQWKWGHGVAAFLGNHTEKYKQDPVYPPDGPDPVRSEGGFRGSMPRGTENILGPVVDRIRRKVYYFYCSHSSVQCDDMSILEMDLVKGTEKIIYIQDTWRFPAPHVSRSEIGRSALGYHTASQTLYWIVQPAANAKRIQLMSLRLNDESVYQDLKTDKSFCHIRTRITWETEEHTGYNAISVACDGTVYLVHHWGLYKWDPATGEETLLYDDKKVRAVNLYPGPSTEDFVYFSTDSDIYKCNAACSNPTVFMSYSQINDERTPIYGGIQAIVNFAFDPYKNPAGSLIDHDMYLMFMSATQGGMTVMKYNASSDSQNDFIGGSYDLQQHTPRRYPDRGSHQMLVLRANWVELNASFNAYVCDIGCVMALESEAPTPEPTKSPSPGPTASPTFPLPSGVTRKEDTNCNGDGDLYIGKGGRYDTVKKRSDLATCVETCKKSDECKYITLNYGKSTCYYAKASKGETASNSHDCIIMGASDGSGGNGSNGNTFSSSVRVLPSLSVVWLAMAALLHVVN